MISLFFSGPTAPDRDVIGLDLGASGSVTPTGCRFRTTLPGRGNCCGALSRMDGGNGSRNFHSSFRAFGRFDLEWLVVGKSARMPRRKASSARPRIRQVAVFIIAYGVIGTARTATIQDGTPRCSSSTGK